MLGWAIGFFVIALIAAVFGFGGVASAFSGIAILLFWVFLALFVLSLIFGAVSHRHGHSVSSGGRTLALIAVVAVVAIAAYAWVDNDWTAEQAGREIDQAAAELAHNTGEALETAGERTEDLVSNTATSMREDAAEGLDNAEERVDPDQDPD